MVSTPLYKYIQEKNVFLGSILLEKREPYCKVKTFILK